MFWGCLYGMLCPAIVGVIAFLGLVYDGVRIAPPDFVIGLFWWGMSVLLCGLIGALISGFVGLIATLCIAAFNESMGRIWSPITAISLSGGLTGFVSASAVWLVIGTPFFVVVSVFYLLGPVFAMILGQVGAMRMSSFQLAKHYQRQRTKVNRLWCGDVKKKLSNSDLKQMLALTGWFAALFAVLSTVGRFSIFLTLVLASYFLIQPPVYFLVNRVFRYYVRRQLDQVLLSEAESLEFATPMPVSSDLTQPSASSGADPFDI